MINKHQNKKNAVVIGVFLLALFLTSGVRMAVANEVVDDYDLYLKYNQYLQYQKKQQYQGYLKYKKVKKYGFKSEAQRLQYQTAHDNYQLYLSDPATYAAYKNLKKQYTRYENYTNKYLPNAEYAPYKSYKQYNKKKYNVGAPFGTQEYLDGYNRYLASQDGVANTLGEADLGGGALGPDITVGLTEYSRTDLQNNAFKVTAKSVSTGNPLDYVIKDGNGTLLDTVSGATQSKVNYVTNKNFSFLGSSTAPIIVPLEIRFESADPTKTSDIVFDFNRPGTDFDEYRDGLILRYFDNPTESDTIWAINRLSMEHYVWGIGEIAGTGPIEHTKTMTAVFRTYGYWKLKFSTKYALQGFKVDATSGNQLYYGYQWETGHPNIRLAAEATRGRLIMYASGSTNKIALSPYSSWTDGRTRSFEERWGGTAYPWCKSVSDPYGKHSTMTTAELEAAGNHMVGLSAHGSLALAGTGYNWKWDDILRYYFRKINFVTAY